MREGKDNNVLESQTKSFKQMKAGETKMLSLIESAHWIRKQGCEEPAVSCLFWAPAAVKECSVFLTQPLRDIIHFLLSTETPTHVLPQRQVCQLVKRSYIKMKVMLCL